jgi:hypothetical protein
MAASLPSAVNADASNMSYTHDAKGRLTSVCNAAPSAGDLTLYRFDAADNRTTYQHSRTDQTLPPGSAIYSPNGLYQFIMQSDGNLVLYRKSGSTWIAVGWSTNTYGSGADLAVFQSDGNLVVYRGSLALWSTNTWQYHCATLAVQSDGNIVIRDVSGNIVWQSNTTGF